MGKRIKIVLGTGVMLAVVATAAVLMMGSVRGAEEVETAEVRSAVLSAPIEASGKIAAGTGAYSDVYPPTTGTLATVHVEDGQRVEAGQRLATLDVGPLTLQVKQATAARAQARAALTAARLQAASAADVRAAAENVAAMKALHTNAKRAYETARTSDTAAGRSNADAAEAVMKQAKAGLASARAALAKARRSTDTRDQRSAAKASESEAEAAYSVARRYLDAAELTAPIDGTVMFNPLGEPGPSGKAPVAASDAAVTPGVAPFSVVDLSGVVFLAEVDEADAGMLEVGNTASVTLDAFSGREMKARIARIEPSARRTATGGTVFVAELEFEDVGDGILIGMKGDATISPAGRSAELIVPADSLLSEGGRDIVYKVVGGRLEKTQVKVGMKTDSQAEVLSGLAAGDVVALPGATPLAHGMAVKALQ